MSRARGTTALLALALLLAGALSLGQATVAAADGGASRTYEDPAYSADYPLAPTRDPGQSKLWYHAGAWWALMVEPTGHAVRVFELMPDHSWRATSAVANGTAGTVGDAIPDGDSVHVVTRGTDGSLLYVRLSYDAAKRDYHAAAPRLVTSRNSVAPPMVAKDAAGALWVGYVTAVNVVVIPSFDGGVTWGRVLTLSTTPTGKVSRSAALVAYSDRVGLLWSDKAAHTFDFASHRAGDDLAVWSLEHIQAPPALANDHVSLVRIPGSPGDTLAAAVTTTPPNQAQGLGLPPVQLLVRTPDGRWSAHPVGTVADSLGEPVLQFDQTNRTLHLFATRDGNIVTKQASLSDLLFPSGPGTLFMNGIGGLLAWPAVAHDSATSATGLIVLASDVSTKKYRHAELPITSPTPVVDPSDHTPPTPPAELQGHAVSQGTVVVSWADSTDGTGWAPARQGIPVQGYVVQRNGVTIAKVSGTAVQDRLPAGLARSGGTTTYQVQAIDASGNLSPASRVVVHLPETTSPPPLYLSVGLISLAVLAAVYALYRWIARRLALRDVTALAVETPAHEMASGGDGRS